MLLLSAGQRLVWQEWDDVYLVYQTASAETHVFNQTTVVILSVLNQGPLPAEKVKELTEEALGIPQGDLGNDDFAFAVGRLDELGLIEHSEQAIAVQ